MKPTTPLALPSAAYDFRLDVDLFRGQQKSLLPGAPWSIAGDHQSWREMTSVICNASGHSTEYMLAIGFDRSYQPLNVQYAIRRGRATLSRAAITLHYPKRIPRKRLGQPPTVVALDALYIPWQSWREHYDIDGSLDTLPPTAYPLNGNATSFNGLLKLLLTDWGVVTPSDSQAWPRCPFRYS